MKKLIKELLREGLLNENFGYRAGDLTNKAEPKSKFVATDRHTGHFGTGFYFFGGEDIAKEYTKITGDRGVSIIKLDGYNLAKGTLELHELLKDVNNSVGDNSNLLFTIKRFFSHFGKLEKSPKPTIKPPRNNREYDLLTPDQIKVIDSEERVGREVDKRNEVMLLGVVNNINNSKMDTASTIVMKSIGFDGVDSRGTELDNARYGSVIYDIK